VTDGQLNPENLMSTLTTIKDYILVCKSYNVQKLRITATQFARVASNAHELFSAIYESSGYPVEVISGDEEARLTYLAVASEFGSECILVFNIGGGSTEFIVATPQQTKLRTSLPIGAGQLSRDFLSSIDIINADEYKNMQRHVRSLIKTNVLPFYISGFSSQLSDFPKIVLSGGTGTNIAQISRGVSIDWSGTGVVTIPASEVSRIEKLLKTTALKIRQNIPGIESNRADILPAGAAIVSTVLQLSRADSLFVTSKSLAHGVICGMLQQ